MTKKCSCKSGKKDPSCTVCNPPEITLDSFHKLNPEAKPKTAESFKLAFAMSPGVTRAMQVGAAGLKGSLPGALAGGAIGLISAPEGEGMAGAARGAMAGGLATGGAAAVHHGSMTGTSDWSKNYRMHHVEGRQRQRVHDRANNFEIIRQRKANEAAAAAPEVKAAQYYQLGQNDAWEQYVR